MQTATDISEEVLENRASAAGTLKILIYTTLFPNSVQQLHGNFILERMRHLLPFVNMTVMAPVPYFPRVNLNSRWFEFAATPHADRKSTRLNSSHTVISYAVFCLKKKIKSYTPRDHDTPGDFSIMSVRVTRSTPARVSLYLRPVEFELRRIVTSERNRRMPQTVSV